MILALTITGIAALICLALSILSGLLTRRGAWFTKPIKPAWRWLLSLHKPLATLGVVLMLAHVALAVWIIPLALLAIRPAAWLGLAGTLLTGVVFVSSLMDHKHWKSRWRLLHSGAAFGYALAITHAVLAGPDTSWIPVYIGLSAIIGLLAIVRFAQIWWLEYLLKVPAIVAASVLVLSFAPGMIYAKSAPVTVTCTLRLPDHPLTAAGLATPFQLEKGCTEENSNESAFAQAAIINPATGIISLYAPLVVDAGTTPLVAPVVPTFAGSDIVALWFGFNGDVLRLSNAHGCQQFEAQYSYCNAPAFFAAANQDIASGLLTVPPLGTATDGLPCPSTRDASVVDQDQSDNLPIKGNGSDNGLLDTYLDPALGCQPWLAPDLSQNGLLAPSLALNELQATK